MAVFQRSPAGCIRADRGGLIVLAADKRRSRGSKPNKADLLIGVNLRESAAKFLYGK